MKKPASQELAIPVELQAALEQHPPLARAFPTFTYAHRRAYVEWVAAAKRPQTRAKRASEAVAMILKKWDPKTNPSSS